MRNLVPIIGEQRNSSVPGDRIGGKRLFFTVVRGMGFEPMKAYATGFLLRVGS
jgi:hypothetical protein